MQDVEAARKAMERLVAMTTLYHETIWVAAAIPWTLDSEQHVLAQPEIAAHFPRVVSFCGPFYEAVRESSPVAFDDGEEGEDAHLACALNGLEIHCIDLLNEAGRLCKPLHEVLAGVSHDATFEAGLEHSFTLAAHERCRLFVERVRHFGQHLPPLDTDDPPTFWFDSERDQYITVCEWVVNELPPLNVSGLLPGMQREFRELLHASVWSDQPSPNGRPKRITAAERSDDDRVFSATFVKREAGFSETSSIKRYVEAAGVEHQPAKGRGYSPDEARRIWQAIKAGASAHQREQADAALTKHFPSA